MNETVLSARWNEAGAKLLQLAEAFPAERYDARPAAEVRSFADQLRHVAFWNEWLRETLEGRPADGAANELSAADYPDKPRILEALRGSFRSVGELLDGGNGTDGRPEAVVPILEHVGEHYGQLVVYCRLAEVVPPASRA